MRRLIGFIVLLLVVAVGLSFALANARPVEVEYFFGLVTIPLSLALVIALVCGALLGMLSAIGLLLRQRRETQRLRRRLSQVEQELSELRKLPLREQT